jgi:hypothetical protein
LRNHNINQSNATIQESIGKKFKNIGKGLMRIFGGNVEDSDDEKKMIAKG